MRGKGCAVYGRAEHPETSQEPALRRYMVMILQWAETQVHSSHSPEHLPGELHGHTWFVRAAQQIGPAKFTPSVINWQKKLETAADAFDHRHLQHGESLAEQLAEKLGVLIGASEVDVWRYTRGGRIGATWRA